MLQNLYEWLVFLAGPILLVLIVLVVVVLAMAISLALKMRRLERHYRGLVAGTDGGNLELVLDAHLRRIEEVACHVEQLAEVTAQLQAASQRYLQHVALLRFNPFRDTGGDQSFALALADADGNGAVLSSLHNRDATRVYGKPLAAWKSTHLLTDEEAKAIAHARSQG